MTGQRISSLPSTRNLSKGNWGALAGFAKKPTSGFSNVFAKLAVKVHPFLFWLTKSERLAIAATVHSVWPCPLATLPSAVCGRCTVRIRRTVFRFEFIERLQRSFQFWCGDSFHAPSVTRSALAVTDWQFANLGDEVRA